MGAQQQGSHQLALVPRTHNISVVVFTKVDAKRPTYDISRLAVITQTTFVDVDTGIEVPSSRNTPAGRLELTNRVAAVIGSYGYVFSSACSSDNHKPLDMLRSLDRGDYSTVKSCIDILQAPVSSAEEAMKRRTADELRLKRVVAELMTVQTDSRFSKLLVQLTDLDNRIFQAPYKDQLVLLSDDKLLTKAVLRGGSNLEAKALDARLRLRSNNQDFELMATGIDVDSSGRVLTATFPSLTSSKLMSTKPNPERGKPDLEEDPAGCLCCFYIPIVKTP